MSKQILFFSDMDLVEGNSGGAAINEFGKLVGINIGGAATSVKYVPLAATVRMSHILTEVREHLGVTTTNQIFNCANQ